MRQLRRIRIKAPPDKVWELIADDSKLPQWMPHIVATRYPRGKPKGNPVGARFVQDMRQGDSLSSYEGEITEYQRGSLFGVLLQPEAFAIHVVYHVTGDEDWTLLEYGADIRPRTARGWLMVWWGRRALGTILDQQLARLRLVAEASS
jgi:hypothetical protein